MTLYEMLGVKTDASDEEIRKAFRAKAHIVHPDKGGNEEDFKRLNEAKAILLDRARRDQYDLSIGLWQKSGLSIGTGTQWNGEKSTVTVVFRWG